ncbi:circularly permuted type 2 ATP-grasp protein [Congregicoccus parvus]|uniref:circularly permuted type 2 ATP-grasp protein n=1 Tax=Congregicoccus parvus TaxID=3081749 RepID=UPI003FA5B1A1
MNDAPRSPPPPHPAHPLPGYTGKPGRFDECLEPDGTLRPAWATFIARIATAPHTALREADEAVRRAILEQDVSMNVYSGDRAGTSPWPLDAVPLLVDSKDWEHIASGLRQRAHLFNALLDDLYGPQRLLQRGRLPAVLAMANPNFLRPCVRPGSSREPFLHLYAADVARSPDGRWWVLEDRLDAPSGLGYSLQNRILVRQALPEVFNATPVRRLQHFFRDLRRSLDRASDSTSDSRVVFLTPGPANETYYEHAYLARYLGFPLVEGADLATRDRRVFLRTVGGLQQVDTILRRVDSEFCDPLELDEGSLLGVPGLVDAMHARRVTLANRLGARALESTALLAYLEPLCRELRDEPLALPSVATWWCGQPEALEYVLANLHSLVVKPTFPSPDGPPTRYGAVLSSAERAALSSAIRTRPWAYCGQERVYLGTTPGWDAANGSLRAMPFTTRIYLAWHEGDYHVMPGGLTRCNPDGEDAIVSLQSGSFTKDTWVIDPSRTSPAPLDPPDAVRTAQRHGHATPSRLADNLFWLGRYVERLGQLARLIGKLDTLLRDEISTHEPAVALAAVRLVHSRLDTAPAPHASAEQLAEQVRRIALDPTAPGGVAALGLRLGHVLDVLKSRLPADVSPIGRRLRVLAGRDPRATFAAVRADLAVLDGTLAETLPRDTGWHFFELGRRLERGCQILHVLQGILAPTPIQQVSEFRLQTILHLADCHFAYRALYPGAFDPPTVLAWLVSDAENARSLRFQAEHIGSHLAALPESLSPLAVASMRDRAFELLARVRLFDSGRAALPPGTPESFWVGLLDVHAELSDRLTSVYFAHAETLGRPVAT